MLNAIERRVVALVADALAGRQDLTVVAAGGPAADPAAGTGILRIGVSELRPTGSFAPATRPVPPGSDIGRRVRPLRLEFDTALSFTRRPADATADAADAARDRLLEDMSLVGHALDAEEVADGASLSDQPGDVGYVVEAFRLRDGAVDPVGADGTALGHWIYLGRAEIWPPGQPAEEGLIAATEVLTDALPLAFSLADPSVPIGGSTTVRIRGVAARKLDDPATGARSPASLAIAVESTLPPDRRGAITSGDPGAEPGVRIVPTADPETIATYKAPASPGGMPPFEHIAIHVALPDGRRGILLATIAVPLRRAHP